MGYLSVCEWVEVFIRFSLGFFISFILSFFFGKRSFFSVFVIFGFFVVEGGNISDI